MLNYNEVAKMIDHSLLKPTLTDADITEGCNLAKRYKVATVCVRPSDVKLAKEILNNSEVLVTTVIGFPHGTTTTLTKLTEVKEAIDNGAVEVDIVMNIGKFKSGKYDYVKNELKALTEVCHSYGVIVKIIFENCYLTDDEIKEACLICNEVGVDFVKTSTGYGTGGAEDKDLIIMRKFSNPEIQVKAAGGVRTLERVKEIKDLGCTRFGCTVTSEMLDQLKSTHSQVL